MIMLTVGTCADINPDGQIPVNRGFARRGYTMDAPTALINLPTTDSLPIAPTFDQFLGPAPAKPRSRRPKGSPYPMSNVLGLIRLIACGVAALGLLYFMVGGLLAGGGGGEYLRNATDEQATTSPAPKQPKPLVRPAPTTAPQPEPEIDR